MSGVEFGIHGHPGSVCSELEPGLPTPSLRRGLLTLCQRGAGAGSLWVNGPGNYRHLRRTLIGTGSSPWFCAPSATATPGNLTSSFTPGVQFRADIRSRELGVDRRHKPEGEEGCNRGKEGVGRAGPAAGGTPTRRSAAGTVQRDADGESKKLTRSAARGG